MPQPADATIGIRPAAAADADAICVIYNHGIAGRQATFENAPRVASDILAWYADELPFLVAVDRDGVLLGWARVGPYSPRPAYAGVGEHAVYVSPHAQGRGIGRQLLDALAVAAEAHGLHKLTSRIFTTNAASLALHRAAGFHEVGIQLRHARLEGEWKDCVLVERLLGPAR
jgi:phosphinothricin acetyltransferase